MINLFVGTITFVTLSLSGCSQEYVSHEQKTGYNLTAPSASFVLPDTLREISGITCLDATSFACVQDENGILFIYDTKNQKIKEQYQFHIDGDYEGIARVKNDMYVLRSDGVLFEISNYRSKTFSIKTYGTGIPAKNNEGLCYDDANNRLLIACKGKIGKGPEFKDRRVIYAFDLKEKKLSANPIMEFDVKQIREYAIANNINLPVRVKKNGQVAEPIIKFRTSAICIHPKTGKLFLLSAADHLIFIINDAGKIEHLELLNPQLFNKAEGISFFDNGDMVISNEGQEQNPTLLLFRYKL